MHFVDQKSISPRHSQMVPVWARSAHVTFFMNVERYSADNLTSAAKQLRGRGGADLTISALPLDKLHFFFHQPTLSYSHIKCDFALHPHPFTFYFLTMPKSKRAKVVHLSKTTKKGKELTLRLFANIREAIPSYPYIYVFSVDNMRNTFLKDVRTELSDSRFVFFPILHLQSFL